jgi:hypothetical protein
MSSLGEELPKEIERVGKIRDEWIRIMAEMGDAGKGMAISIDVMRAEIAVATKAIAEGNIEQMMRSYDSLKAYEDN